MAGNLSHAARALWAKLSRQNNDWLPLYIHMADSAAMARLLWQYWLSDGVKKLFEELAPGNGQALFVFLAAAHDLGKASPVFQLPRAYVFKIQTFISSQLKQAGLPLPLWGGNFPYSHAHISQFIAAQNGLSPRLSVVLGGHHGVPPANGAMQHLQSYPAHIGRIGAANGQQPWLEVQNELFSYALKLSGLEKSQLCNIEPGPELQMLLTGLVIMVDWLVSDAGKFPYIGSDENCTSQSSHERAGEAWEKWNCAPCWLPPDEGTLALYDLYAERFNISPRPMQQLAADKILDLGAPGLVILEAAMGEGKTEAALVMAEILVAKTGRSGVFFALPTQATSNAIFPRMRKWIAALDTEEGHSIILAHAKAMFNEEYRGLLPENNHGHGKDGISVNAWFCGRKKGLLADFVVGTIDQLLMAGLKQRHLALRHLGLANKVVIIDECHAYDAYMNSYLHKALNWLGKMQVPVIVLSATLPGHIRQELMSAYLLQDFAPSHNAVPWLNIEEKVTPPPAWAVSTVYPALTYNDGNKVEQLHLPVSKRQLKVQTQWFAIEYISDKLKEVLINGGCAGVMVNTVKRAQDIYLELAACFGRDTVKLLHSRFIPTDRASKEEELQRLLGPNDNQRPDKLIVVGTQVMEQSLDIDFDVLFSDISPMDLLIQRMGRLHRHNRPRPAGLVDARCFVTGVNDGAFEQGSKAVYGQYLLMNTMELLPPALDLPQDIPVLVQKAYAKEGLPIDTLKYVNSSAYAAAKEKHLQRINAKRLKAKNFQINPPNISLISGLLDTAINDDNKGLKARAAVRDTNDSVEVLLLYQQKDGELHTMPWGPLGDKKLPLDETPDNELAQALAGSSLILPAVLTADWSIDKTIKQLEQVNLRQIPASWQQSHWLKDELFLVLDENFNAQLGDYILHYEQELGLAHQKTSEKEYG